MDSGGRIWEIIGSPQPQETDITLFAPTQDHMMKKLSFALITSSVITALLLAAQPALAQTEPQTRATKPARAATKPVESLSMNFSKVVPKNQRYVIFDAKGQPLSVLKSGTSTAEVTDCAQIPCPPTFGDDVVCWKCVEQITSNQGSTE